jgi:hypothetical protein
MIRQIRLDLLAVLSELSERFPDQRLGQLVSNLATLAREPVDENEFIWDVEDEELLAAARELLKAERESRP